jgi:serine protease AprX
MQWIFCRSLRLNVCLLALLCLLTGLSPDRAVPASGQARLQPALQQLALAHPEAPVSIIVQKTTAGAGVELEVARLGGTVTKDLSIINAFAAELSAAGAADLAQAKGVRWVSLDAPVQQSDQTQFTSWATVMGTALADSIHDSSLLVDSALGPNGTFGSGFDNNRGSFTGFTSEATPGSAISKVEVLLKGYAPYLHHDFKVKLYLAGHMEKDYSIKWETWTAYTGPGGAGLVAVDVTSARSWKWADLENSLEVGLDLGGLDGKDSIAFDAIGLRVSSTAGSDAVADLGGDNSTVTTIDGSQQRNVYNQVIGATALWNSRLVQGKGATVAVVDSGIFKTKDLDKRIRANVKFNSAFHDAADRFGHGTFVAGIVGGNGAQGHGAYIGVAPRADLLNVRVSDDNGMSSESDVVGALQWVLQNKQKYNIRVVNLSLNSSVAQSYQTSPLAAAAEILWFNGIVVVVAAGNNGTATLYPPANDPFVITVGATDDRGTASTGDDVVATFSAFGMTDSGVTKPDLVAPGRNIIGLLPENDKLSIGRNHPANQLDKSYFRMSGTSVSAPMVSGAVALLLQDEPGLTPDQVKYRLMSTANRNWAGYDASKAGAGYLDIYAAVLGTTTESANTGTPVSTLLTTSLAGVLNPTVSWNSVSWNSVSWNSVSWNSVSWNSVSWNSDYWEQ